MDKICYLDEYFINSEEGYYDLIFNLNIKKHELFNISSQSRYDIYLDWDITWYEYYYGGKLKVPFLDKSDLELSWDAWNNGKYINTITKPNMGLLFIEDNNYIMKGENEILNREIRNSVSRGNLKINLHLKILYLLVLVRRK